jgi:hypothetical protein
MYPCLMSWHSAMYVGAQTAVYWRVRHASEYSLAFHFAHVRASVIIKYPPGSRGFGASSPRTGKG